MKVQESDRDSKEKRTMRLYHYVFMPAVLALLTAGCTSVSASVAGQVAAPEPSITLADCPITQPPASAFVPPAPWPVQPPSTDQFWFGDSGLWTALPLNGSWRQLALGKKFWWWSQEFDVNVDSTPDLALTARRLDGDAPTFQVSEATNGYHESFHWAMLHGVTLGSPGCWEFTGQYNDHQLSFVLWVSPE
jgi:hypothetical protein